jgi:CheY-like chemotaxis protein
MKDDAAVHSPPPDALAGLGRVAGELVHDLANEVQVLHSWAQLARGEAEVGNVPAAELGRVVHLSSSLARMLRDVLGTLSGQTLSHEVDFDPTAVTEATLSDWLPELLPLTVRLRSTLPADVRVAGHQSFWVRTLVNLLRNAARHARSEVLIRLSLADGLEQRPRVVLRVEDDGAGLPHEVRDAVFHPFFRGTTGGTGLGLSSVSWMVSQLRGEVRYVADSTLGGAGFEVRVPARRGSRAPEGASEGGGALQGLRLLLVDDDPAVRFALTRLLRRVGAEVRELDPVGMPEEQVVASVVSSLPDAILLDLHLGERGGLGLWRRMRQDLPQQAERVLFISGSAPGDASWEEAHRTGQPVLAKPFEMTHLVQALSRFGTAG